MPTNRDPLGALVCVFLSSPKGKKKEHDLKCLCYCPCGSIKRRREGDEALRHYFPGDD